MNMINNKLLDKETDTYIISNTHILMDVGLFSILSNYRYRKVILQNLYIIYNTICKRLVKYTNLYV